ncbi:MAG: Uma2 family endonuclease [Calothrix sp. FI2-JRJ7]|nr:Uma2 family endonuclease [Calothrix sp. FI2-JRJ7]
MTQAVSKTITVDEFIKKYGDNERYELIDRELIGTEPTGLDEQLIAFIGRKLNVEIDRQYPDYFIVREYWIVDYLGIGGREYIGKPKQPTITICTLNQDEYQRQLFRNEDTFVSTIFPNLQLTAKQVFESAR